MWSIMRIWNFQKEVYHEVAKVVNLSAIEGATPSPFVYMLDGYGIKWSGKYFLLSVVNIRLFLRVMIVV